MRFASFTILSVHKESFHFINVVDITTKSSSLELSALHV